MSARQIHGFKFEDAVKKILNIQEEKSYTSKWDIGDSISVKYIKVGGSIMMGDIKRQFEPLQTLTSVIILGRHQDRVCTDVCEVEVTAEIWSKLHGSLTLEEVTAFDKKLKSFPVGQHLEARAYAKEWIANNKHKIGMLTVNPKIDRNAQRRVQCSINTTNFNILFNVSTSPKFKVLIGGDFA